MKLADIGVEGGLKASIRNTMHIYDDDQQYTYEADAYPSDALDDFASKYDNVFFCGDIEAYNVLNLTMNQPGTFLNKVGLYKRMELLNEKNNSLLPGEKHHLENWHFVKECTRKNKHANKIQQKSNEERITIHDYSIHLDEGTNKEVRIKTLPTGYTKQDLIYCMNNASIASVNKDGVVTGLQAGDAILRISTKDHAYQIFCNIHVRGKRKQA